MKGKYLLLVITMMIRPYLHNAKYYETDQMGIIHHSNYIRWFEEARIDYMNQIGLTYKKMEEEGIISPVLSINCNYQKMMYFDDLAIIEVKITNILVSASPVNIRYIIKNIHFVLLATLIIVLLIGVDDQLI